MHIETDRLVIRSFELTDAEDLQEILGDEETMKYCEPAYSIELTKNFLKDFCIDKNGAAAAVQKESGKVIGYILFNQTAKDIYEIGWFFNRRYWGKGYAFEACSEMIDYAFNKLNVHKIFAETIDTVKSVRLMKKLGMVCEGVQRDHIKAQSGNWANLYIYGILNEKHKKNGSLTIRQETENDYKSVENIIREAFWNVSVPGCDEHYLAHILRDHEDFIPALDLVAELNGQVIGNVMYTKSKLVDEQGIEKEILTFGPISVLPEFQRQGIGKALLEQSFLIAANLGYEAIVIFGNPDNYVARGFKSCKKFNVCLKDDYFPAAMLVKELKEGALDGRKYYFRESPAFDYDRECAKEFDKGFEPKEKKFAPSQEEFFIHSHSRIN